MSARVFCDGCEQPITNRSGPMLSGKRRDGEGGGGIPQGEFHLCDDCTFVAFHAMTRRPVGEYVDRHQLATEICDAQVERRRS